MFKWVIKWYFQRSGLVLGALAKTLDKDKWEKLPKDVQSAYVEKDGKYLLDIEGDEDVSGLKSALDKERNGRKAAEKLYKELKEQFEGLDPDVIKDIMSKFDTDEDAKLIKAGKIDEVVQRRVEMMRKEMEKEFKKRDDATAKEKARADKFSSRVLENHIRQAATKAGIHQHAVDDAIFRGRSMFSLNEEGDAIVLDEGGNVKMGKDGKTPLSPVEWLESMKESAPHWYPSGSSGGGSQGNKGGTNGAKVVKRSEYNAMDPAARKTLMTEIKENKAQLVD
jgi:hypothetical protein